MKRSKDSENRKQQDRLRKFINFVNVRLCDHKSFSKKTTAAAQSEAGPSARSEQGIPPKQLIVLDYSVIVVLFQSAELI